MIIDHDLTKPPIYKDQFLCAYFDAGARVERDVEVAEDGGIDGAAPAKSKMSVKFSHWPARSQKSDKQKNVFHLLISLVVCLDCILF